MKFTRTLASVAAAALAVSSLAIGASAAVFKATVEENGAPASNKWELKYDESVYEWAPNVTKVVATITNEAYVNGVLGGNVINADGTSTLSRVYNNHSTGNIDASLTITRFQKLVAGSFLRIISFFA